MWVFFNIREFVIVFFFLNIVFGGCKFLCIKVYSFKGVIEVILFMFIFIKYLNKKKILFGNIRVNIKMLLKCFY